MLFCLNINDGIPLEQAWNEIENHGIEVLYGTEEEGKTQLFIKLDSLEDLPSFDCIINCTPYTLPPIDWNSQWAEHGVDFKDGKIHIAFDKYGKGWKTLSLKPGPGFGDLSHPTTRLVLGLMANYLQGESVVDIGCGSGILSLAACAMGAPKVDGIDIEKEALQHSKENAHINGYEGKCRFMLPSEFKLQKKVNPVLVVMNMISSEQQIAWSSLPILHHINGKILTSGIRREERHSYLELTKQWGWTLLDEVQEEEWLGFCFRLNQRPLKG